MSENKVTVLGKNAEERLEILRDEKGNILLTDDQKRAVLERGRILVSASAGSGAVSDEAAGAFASGAVPSVLATISASISSGVAIISGAS